MMVEADEVADDNSHAVAPALPHAPQRRPRVREVSSRFMSPVGDPAKSLLLKQHHQSISAQRQRRLQETETDENRPAHSETPRPSDSPFIINTINKHKKHQHSSSKLLDRSPSTPLKPDTPTSTINSFDRTPSLSSSSTTTTKIRLNHRSGNISSTVKASAAAKLLQSSGMALSSKSDASSSSQSQEASSSLVDLRSSMPEANKLPSVPTRLLIDRNLNNDGDSSKLPPFPLSRSLNSPLSTSEPYLFHHPYSYPPIKDKSAKMVPLSLPPVPSNTKPKTAAVRRPKKVSGHQEDLHFLKLLHNHYLQWRFANTKAEASMKIQKRETEVRR